MWEGINQRKFPRVSYKCLIRINKDSGQELIDTFTENVGAGGICVVVDRDLGLFEKVDLEIFLTDSDEPIKCGGSVVWVVKRHAKSGGELELFDTGIEFVDIKDKDVKRVEGLVQNILDT